MFKKKILIIDDTDLMVKLTRDTLEEKGFDVVSANNGMDGIRMVMTEKRTWCSLMLCRNRRV